MRGIALVVLTVLLCGLASVAVAQPEPQPAPSPPGLPTGEPPSKRQPAPPPGGERPDRPKRPPPRPGTIIARPESMPPVTVPQAKGRIHEDVTQSTPSQSKPWLALCFWLFALTAVGGAVFVITRRNLIAAVMGMVGAFFGIAATYMMLYASFLAVVQLLVYAGAIMVLFVFVIMILNRPEDEPWGPVGVFGKGLAGLGLAYLTYRLVALVWSVEVSKTALPAPVVKPVLVGKDQIVHDFGSVGGTGTELFGHYLFPFEAISILLLVAVVGAIAVARPIKPDEGVPPPEGAP